MVTIRNGRKEDLELVQKLYLELDDKMYELLLQLIGRGSSNASDYEHPKTYWEDLLAGKDGFILIAEVDTDSIGMAVVLNVNEKEYHLEDLIVFEEYRGNGVGRELLKKAKEEVKARGGKVFSLNVLPNNDNAKKLYLEEGFQEIKIRMESML